MKRPEGCPSGYQNWRDLLFAHWTLPVEAVRALVPAQLELDLWDGRAFVGVVPFAMQAVRPRALPRFMALDFLETNVRTYVRYRGRPGVYFFSLEASSLVAVKAARWGWGLPYFHARMSMLRGDAIEYATVRRGAAGSHRVRYRPGRMLGASREGTLEHFLLERYLLYAVRGDRVFEGQVSHVPYPAQDVAIDSIEDDLVVAAGLPRGDFACAHYAAGVDVEVFGPYPVSVGE